MPRNKKPSDDDNLEFPLDTPADDSSTEPALDAESGTELETAPEETEDIFEQKPLSGHVDDMFSEWFLDYASYVILERAVPHANDGLKPVQRRILHSMRELEDGRYNKVANVIGNTMKYHPHGDASIGDAMVQLGQKELLIDMQGNWGNTLTGDSAAAARYIEARLSKFALEVVFNPKTTNWLASYDGRNKEPETQPVKFPLLLAQGAEGIAVGLSCKILPHNFIELLEGCISFLRKETPEIVPDFPTGGIADVSEYNNGKRGGRVKCRARIEARKKNLLAITELPFGKTTTSLIDSIISANEKSKIKIQRVEDNTADTVEILVYLPSGVDVETAEQALYAFTDCEVSISTNICVIENDRPHFYSAQDLLYLATEKTRELLKMELEIELAELEEKWHFSSLEKIFIEKRIYRRIEEEETWEAVIETVDVGLKPYKKLFKREITRDDILRLLEIKIKRISKFDAIRADELIKGLEERIEETQRHLKQLTKYTIRWFKELIKNYGKGRERKTELASFKKVLAHEVVIANETLYVDYKEGFAGYGMKKDESVCKCSTMDDIISINQEGKLIVSKVSEKAFFGKNILHLNVFNRAEPNALTYCMVYRDGRTGPTVAKHFTIGGVTRDKEYDLTKGKAGSRVFYISCYATEGGDPDAVKVNLKPAPRLRKTEEEILFRDLAVRGRATGGNVVTKNPVRNVVRMTKAAREEAENR
ncbi:MULTISPECIES: DNA gyrase/topoisomerase IV subunit A [unclassified Lentimonas]|uniref:DNA gyrase/topoisomerase IV subunit A n=1 Tax=unclassified Lentimonas TaxID=2630993 RepID=UPI00132A0987|nr:MULTISPECIES: DNA gyrase/topoisomerase IV subunit A [unclassified Lentimonas]CAA6679284.1 Topoisomerase IV subunit A (EC [Lentimonas sp. CC4]CAA6686318.1 Topoisomerase IV subunit A (EC [Lentimonas sp. CC6]CAA6695193.1 Topoisomerase IV subunit A (EC [Lentimonas sp. CC19]CAA6697276.1 Topoisomerase IV subunit A (EC [Lentimonas sp. CC10]CAA7070430.1 Topoisomerase IV subunit A (EC [Lentimonas sp. CC11]